MMNAQWCSRQVCVRLALLPTVLLLLAVTNGQAIQPTPPVTVEVREETKDPTAVTASLTVTAQLRVSDAVLVVRMAQGVETERTRIPLDLPVKQPVNVSIPLRVQQAGEYRVQFEIQASAEGYETAGTSERRYLVADGKNPVRILTGRQLRREKRSGIEGRLSELAKSGEMDVTLDSFLAGSLARIPGNQQIEHRGLIQPLAPPAGGIEPYERQQIVDGSAEVVRDRDPITVIGRIFYTDRNGSLRPLVNATVDIRDNDAGPDEHLTSVVTGWDGRFSATVNNNDGWFQNGRDIYIRVRTTNGRFRVQDCSYLPDWTYAWSSETRHDLSDGAVVDFGDRQTVTSNEASILFQDLNQGWNFLTTSGGQDPGFVDLCFPEDASAYSTFWEEIDIEDGDEVARDIVLHEYGHATMHNAYDGHWPSNTGGSHGFDDILHQNFAFTEGWATFIALAINDDGVYHSNGWSRPIESFTHSSGHNAGDGQVNEGHVAAGVGDVRDVNSEGNCTVGNCDPSGAHAVPMASIWRDALWRSNADNIGEYWTRLCNELNWAQRGAALQALAFNDIIVPDCACSIEVAAGDRPDAAHVVSELRDFRDRGLKNTSFGRRIIEMYYKHTREVARLMLRDNSLRQTGLTLVQRASSARSVLLKGDTKEILVDSKVADLARNFITQAQKLGSSELRQDFETLKPLVDDLEGVSAGAIGTKLEAMETRQKKKL
jgi:hypothetical protein